MDIALAALSHKVHHHRQQMDRCRQRPYDIVSTAAYLHSLYAIQEITWDMAKKIAKSNDKEKKQAEFKGFANVELSAEEKAEMKEWIRDADKVQVELDELVASGYKMTFFRSEATGGYQATAFCRDASSVNAGLILSAFAPHWWDALGALAYKHAVHCEGIWPSDETGKDLWG